MKPAQHDVDSAKNITPYKLDIPKGWNIERIAFPIEFAPDINYSGTEDLRFAPGWENIGSDEHWCYAFVWWLDGKPAINADTLKENLTSYYSGLIGKNVRERSIPQIKLVPTIVSINKTETTAGDSATYKGAISMLDYIAQSPIILNCLVHVKNCSTPNHTAIFFEISPKPYDHAVWQQLNDLNSKFECAG